MTSLPSPVTTFSMLVPAAMVKNVAHASRRRAGGGLAFAETDNEVAAHGGEVEPIVARAVVERQAAGIAVEAREHLVGVVVDVVVEVDLLAILAV